MYDVKRPSDPSISTKIEVREQIVQITIKGDIGIKLICAGIVCSYRG